MTPSNHQTIADQSPTYVSLTTALREMTERFMTTGVAWHKMPDLRGLTEPREIRRKWREQLSILGRTVTHGYLKQVAKELRKPFLHAETKMWGVAGDDSYGETYSTKLTVPYTARMANVVSALTLAAVDIPETGYWNWTDASRGPVVRRQGKSVTQFFFHGDAGHRVFEGWIELCRTDPVFRVTLKNK